MYTQTYKLLNIHQFLVDIQLYFFLKIQLISLQMN